MASRREEKEQARARRLEFERQQAMGTRRRRRVQTLVLAIVLAVVIVGVAVALSSSGGGGGGGTKGIASGTKANRTVTAVASLLKGIPQSGSVLGSPSAPVTMTYFGDLQCPVCRDFTLQTLPEVIQREVRAGKLKIRYRSLETATPDPKTFVKQQVAALAAGRQSRMWQYVELFYHQQGREDTGYVTEHYLTTLAQQTPGLNVARWKSARSDPALADQVRADATAAQIAGANATPTLIFKGPRGTQTIASIAQFSDVQRAVQAVAG